MNGLDLVLDQLGEYLRPLVEDIENSTPVTQNHYGAYMSMIEVVMKLAEKNDAIRCKPDTLRLAIGVAIKRVGANEQGVDSALQVMGVLPSQSALY